MMKPGDKVYYISGRKRENGIVKNVVGNTVFVVFNCGEDWENYANYTAAGCNINSLKPGWYEDTTED